MIQKGTISPSAFSHSKEAGLLRIAGHRLACSKFSAALSIVYVLTLLLQTGLDLKNSRPWHRYAETPHINPVRLSLEYRLTPPSTVQSNFFTHRTSCKHNTSSKFTQPTILGGHRQNRAHSGLTEQECPLSTRRKVAHCSQARTESPTFVTDTHWSGKQ